jgi:8-oxo-dGTP diphosphatase
MSDYTAGEPEILEPEKIKELAWVNFDSLPNPLFQPWQQLLRSEFIGAMKQQLKNT